MRDCSAKSKGVHVWYFVIEPVDVQAKQVWERPTNKMSLLHIFIFTVLCDSTNTYRMVIQTLTDAHKLAMYCFELCFAEYFPFCLIIAQNLSLHIYHLLSINKVHKIVLMKLLSLYFCATWALGL